MDMVGDFLTRYRLLLPVYRPGVEEAVAALMSGICIGFKLSRAGDCTFWFRNRNGVRCSSNACFRLRLPNQDSKIAS